MSPEIVGLIGIAILLILMFLGMWVGMAMIVVSFLGIIYLQSMHISFIVIQTVPYKYIAFYTFSAVPLFILMGLILSNSGVSADLFNTANKWLGQLKGGLAIATCVASAILGVITDSMVAVITMGKCAVPEMKRLQYDDKLTVGSILAGGSLASIIPPSLGFILFGILTEVSIGKLFIAGILPGIMFTVIYIITIVVMATINPKLAPKGPPTTFKEKLVSLKFTWATMALFIFILFGIYGGVFTPTEAGALGAFGSIVICLAGRRLKYKVFSESVMEATKTTAMITILVMGAFIFMKFLAVSELSFTVSQFVSSLPVSKYVIFIAIIIIYIVLGSALDMISVIILTMPIIFPTVLALGFDPLWYGVVVVLLIEMGQITPPEGMNMFVLSSVERYTPGYCIPRCHSIRGCYGSRHSHSGIFPANCHMVTQFDDISRILRFSGRESYSTGCIIDNRPRLSPPLEATAP